MAYSPNAVVAQSFSFPDYTFTMNISGAVTLQDTGKAVTLDATADNTVKLAGDGDEIFGRLESIETGGLDGLTVGAVSRKFRAPLPTNGSAISRNVTVVGAGSGLVKAGDTRNPALNLTVTAAANGFVVVEQL